MAAAPAGLSSVEAERRLADTGPNLVVPARPPSPLVRVGRQLTDPLVLLLLGALVVTLAVGDVSDAIIIAVVVVVNTAIGVSQEARAEAAIAALDSLTAPHARVVRDGADAMIPAAELVEGDLVRIEAGDIVPADLRLSAAHQLGLDEAALTGESVAVYRAQGEEALAGTVVVSGRGAGVVTRTGEHSALGRIAAAVARTPPGLTPLQRRLVGLGRVIGVVVVALSAVVFLIGLARGVSVVQMAITAVSLVVAAVPESLPAVVTLALALGARRMAARKAIPRRLHAVETLGSVTIVASDKTGTLTEGQMAVQVVVTADGAEYEIDGRGYEPTGRIAGPQGTADTRPLQALARAALLCSDASVLAPTPERPQWRPAGDPMEAALYALACRCGLDPQAERAGHPRVAEIPFDAATRRMTTTHTTPEGTTLVVCKGAPESVLGPPIVAEVPPGAQEAAQRLTERGLRVLAVAAGERGAVEENATPAPGAAPARLRVLGLVGIGDPIREQAAETAREFDAAGIRLLLITGDHPGTAAAVGAQVGVWRPGDKVHHGDAGPPAAENAESYRVFARVPPEQKLDIISALRGRGHVVAMTGDGVNDAPALRRADIGVAMGKGTEVARQAADLILVDENLATMAVAVREGRRIYDNIRRFLHYGLSGGVAEVLVMLAGPLVGLALPLLPAQILWINLLTHGIPGVALGAEPASPGAMRRPPRPPQESVLGAGLAAAIGWTGLALALVALGAGLIAHAAGRPWQTILFLVLGLGQLGVALAVRARRGPGSGRNPALGAAVAASALLMLAALFVPFLRDLLGTEPLSPAELAWCFVAACVPGAGVLAVRAGRGRGQPAPRQEKGDRTPIPSGDGD